MFGKDFLLNRNLWRKMQRSVAVKLHFQNIFQKIMGNEYIANKDLSRTFSDSLTIWKQLLRLQNSSSTFLNRYENENL